jgi:hypothetical protein
MIQTRDLVVAELRSRQFEVLSVPDDLSAAQTISWINSRARTGDVALEIHMDAATNPNVRGASVFYVANNDQRRGHAELMLLALLRRVPELPSRGARPDTEGGINGLAFCRQLTIPSLQMTLGFLTNPTDRGLLQNRRRDFAVGLADGLTSWSRAVGGGQQPGTYPTIDININGGIYDEKGLLINENSYIPIDLVDQLGIDLTQAPDVQRREVAGIVYVKAVDLRPFGISVNWDGATRTVILRNMTPCPGQIDRIMGRGTTTEMQLNVFLRNNNADAVNRYPDIARIYREEAAIEGVNHDIAFCQMCLETSFLRFGGAIRPEQNNFASLGDVSGSTNYASFPSVRIGVRAHIQHLKAYGSTAPLVQGLVDPRFRFIARGVAPLVQQLSGRWSADPNYGDKILNLVMQLYDLRESSAP